MFRFRPTVETLDARTLPSAVLASPADLATPTVQTVQFADASGDVADQDDSVTANKGGKTGTTQHEYLRVTLTDVLISS